MLYPYSKVKKHKFQQIKTYRVQPPITFLQVEVTIS